MAEAFDTIKFLLIQVVFLIFSVMVHEVFHGLTAHWLGDDMAKREGRLTLNPLKHLDPLGSVILPIILGISAFFSGSGIIFGWAKPVPYNPHNLKYKKYGPSLVAIAGPVSNFALAAIFGIFLRFMPVFGIPFSIPFDIFQDFINIIAFAVFINLLLAVFNLVPIPPLDGSQLLFSVLPSAPKFQEFRAALESYGFLILILFLFFGFRLIIPPILFLFRLITGFSFI